MNDLRVLMAKQALSFVVVALSVAGGVTLSWLLDGGLLMGAGFGAVLGVLISLILILPLRMKFLTDD